MERVQETKFSIAEQIQNKLNMISLGNFSKIIRDEIVAEGPSAVQREVSHKLKPREKGGEGAFFTGKGDEENCMAMLKKFGDQMQEALEKARDQVQADERAATLEQVEQERKRK